MLNSSLMSPGAKVPLLGPLTTTCIHIYLRVYTVCLAEVKCNTTELLANFHVPLLCSVILVFKG